MSIEPVTAAPSRSSSRRIIIPALVVVALGIAWSVFWVVASRQAEARLEAFLADEAGKGRTIGCGERSLGGFPFRLELRCHAPRVDVTREDGSFAIAAKDFVAVAQVYDPLRVIAEATGPLTVTPIGARGPLEASWQSAEASFSFTMSGPQRISLVAEGLSVSEAFQGAPESLLASGRLEAHTRLSEGENAAPGSYDIVARVDAKDLPPLDKILGGDAPAKIEFQGRVTRLLDLAPKPLDERLKQWKEDGGRLEVTLLRIDRGPVSASASGDLALDDGGQPVGKLDVALAGVKDLAKQLKRAHLMPGAFAGFFSFGLSALGQPTSIDGKPAVQVPVTLAKGQAAIGGFPLGDTPRFF